MYKMRPDPKNLCKVCKGWGYTDDVADEYKSAPVIKNKKVVTLGSGCYNCKGTGLVKIQWKVGRVVMQRVANPSPNKVGAQVRSLYLPPRKYMIIDHRTKELIVTVPTAMRELIISLHKATNAPVRILGVDSFELNSTWTISEDSLNNINHGIVYHQDRRYIR